MKSLASGGVIPDVIGAATTEADGAGILDAHETLEQLAFVLRSVVEDANGMTGLSQDIALRLTELTERLASISTEMESIASVLMPKH